MAQSSEKQNRQHRQSLNSLQGKIDKSALKLLQLSDLEAKIAELESTNESHLKEKDALETERDEMRRYAAELVEKVKKETEGKEFMIDRRMINTFLVQYANPKSDEGTKAHMLDAMSKILGFTMEEKQVLGLVQRQQIEEEDQDRAAANAQPKDIKGVGQALFSFLMGDEEFQ